MEEKKGYRAVGKYLMVSPKNVRPIADLIRRKPYTESAKGKRDILLRRMSHITVVVDELAKVGE